MICPNIAGTWAFYGQPIKDGRTGKGQIDMSLVQNGTELAGRLVQAIDPWTEKPPENPDSTRGSIIGRMYVSEHQRATLIELVRVNDHNDLKAIFTGILSPNFREITGCFVNNHAAHGSFVMRKVST
jgi:hypothetical protein